jgi:hypothetical protein
MSQAAIHVRPGDPADEPQAVGVITLAFAADPMARWAFPDPETYLNLMPDFVRAFGGNGIAAYLESSNPRNISLYERHGFERLGTIQSGASPTMVPMLRPPRRQ